MRAQINAMIEDLKHEYDGTWDDDTCFRAHNIDAMIEALESARRTIIAAERNLWAGEYVADL